MTDRNKDPVTRLERRPFGTLPGGEPVEAITLANAAGMRACIITYGAGVHWALALAEEMNLDADILDLRTLLPWDEEAVRRTVAKNGRVLLLHEDTLTGGLGGEIGAWIAEHCFQCLDAPLVRVASLDTAIPFSRPLEKQFLPQQRLREAVEKLLSY